MRCILVTTALYRGYIWNRIISKLFQPSSTSVWNNFVSALGNLSEIISNHFRRLLQPTKNIFQHAQCRWNNFEL